ncbi:MAG TPA: metallophosphoesterase [Thermoanaerobaculia bacterium]|nr:metallophosphoesterase [Thermoanaerobaculia bacterium]
MRKSPRAIALASQSRIVLFAAIWLSLFAYAGRPVLAGAAAVGVAPAGAWTILLVLSLLPLLPFFARRGHATGYTILALFSSLLVLVLLSDVARGVYLFARSMAGRSWPLLDPRTLMLTILGAAVALSAIGLAQARCPRIRRVSVPIDHLPAELDGYRIVQWSDVHVSHTIRRRFVQSLVERTNALEADAVAITGDFVDGPLSDLRDEVEPLRELRARDGVFYVTGNHEYYWRVSEWCPALQSLGLEFLKNEYRVVTRNGASIVFAGVTDPVGRYTHKQDPVRALAGAPAEAVKVLLSHRPQTAKAASKLGVDLQLSGHTHGGQFFPFNLVIRKFQPIVAGLHRVGRTWLYVNRGTGYWGPPTRLAVGGEITVLELRRA